MKRNLIFVALLGLGFGACKKDEAIKSTGETIVIDGEDYEKDFVYKTISRILALPKDSIYYNKYNHTLNIDYLNFSMDIDKFGPDLRHVKTGKYEK